ncbi:MAG: septal ring lytic transglycosylase RlpA family protein [Halomonas sp.]|nr:septal ring lytic transglycosylase RlpA family protein [Halomonas sp.]MDN6296454.1 septal ring lytic transglycosylase RlpA family protein [Halomonas sp.]MDN6313807.1 septal ring lytic transglycosylase RlpA family protein [Halomonas sp.]MDN6335261.1 septal ring lytic transglycosylase RlpA family protein [Halomonas sp.]
MRHRRGMTRPAATSRTLLCAGVACTLLALAGCASQSAQSPENAATAPAGKTATDSDEASGGGRYAMSADAYPLDPPDVSDVPDAIPRKEPLSRAGNRSTYTVWGKSYRVLPDAKGYSETGTASWYGKKFHGYATSSGEIYDMYEMSAAHRSLPLPTFARVTRVGTDKSVIVRVNDRGPFHSERVIDLSYAAASRLGLTDHGTGRVKVEAIDPEQWLARHGNASPDERPPRAIARKDAPSSAASDSASPAPVPEAPAEQSPSAAAESGIYWQVAALENRQGAQKLQRRLEGELEQAVRITEADGMYRVQVGPVAPASGEAELRETLRSAGFPRAFIVR